VSIWSLRRCFQNGSITVSGLHWCKDEPKTVGLASLPGKILCRKHNSELSELEDNVKRAFQAIDASMQLHDVRSDGSVRSHRLDITWP
jgi:hypothetical protein